MFCIVLFFIVVDHFLKPYMLPASLWIKLCEIIFIQEELTLEAVSRWKKNPHTSHNFSGRWTCLMSCPCEAASDLFGYSLGRQSEFCSHTFTSSHHWAGPIAALFLSHWWREPPKHLFNIPWLWSQSRSVKRLCASSLWQGASSFQLQVCGVLFQRSSHFDTSFSCLSTCLCLLQYLPSVCILDELDTRPSENCSFLICLDGSNHLNAYQGALFRS